MKGFSLIEMAMVLVILGLMLSGLLVPLTASIDQTRVSDTKARMTRAEEALLGFAAANGRLPCADTDGDGNQEAPPCGATEGNLPWATLGLSQAEGVDAWGSPFRYLPDQTFATLPVPSPPNTSSGLVVEDLAGAAVSAPNPEAPAALLLSYGKDGVGNLDNGTLDNRYTEGALCLDADCAVHFDDRLVTISKHVVLSRMVLAGQWP